MTTKGINPHNNYTNNALHFFKWMEIGEVFDNNKSSINRDNDDCDKWGKNQRSDKPYKIPEYESNNYRFYKLKKN